MSSCKHWEKLSKSIMEAPTMNKTITRDVEIRGSCSPTKLKQTLNYEEKKNDSLKNSKMNLNLNNRRRFHHRSTSAQYSPYSSNRWKRYDIKFVVYMSKILLTIFLHFNFFMFVEDWIFPPITGNRLFTDIPSICFCFDGGL